MAEATKKLVFAAATLLVLGVLNYSIYEKEQLLDNGELVYLELAPVDPRSLLQGDYMQLRFAIVDEFIIDEMVGERETRGFVGVCVAGNGVATNILTGPACPNGEKEVKFRFIYAPMNSGILPSLAAYRFTYRIVPDSFFFQEGHGQVYLNARYGVFKFGPSGDYLLVGLADENLELIQPPSD